MAGNVTGQIAGQYAELNNAATEATLAELLKVAKGQAGSIAKMAQQSGVAGGAGAGSVPIASLAKFASEAETASRGLGSLGTVFKVGSVAGAVLGDLTNSAIKTGGNLVNLSSKLIDGADRMSDFFAAFKDLPVLGIVAGLFQKIASIQEANLTTYRQLSESGVNFAGSLTQVRKTALDMGLTLDELSSVVSKNSAILASAGSAQLGMNKLQAIQKSLMEGANRELLNLGYTTAQQTELTTSYLKSQGTINKQNLKDNDAIAKSVAAYGKELDLVSKFTGMQRKELQETVEKNLVETSFQQFLSGLDPKKADAIRETITRLIAVGGQPMADAFKAQAMGLPPLTEQSQLLTATMTGTADAMQKYTKIVNDDTLTAEQKRAKMDEVMAEQIASAGNDMAKLSTVLQAGGLSGSSLNTALQDFQKTVMQNRDQGRILSQQEILDKIRSARISQDLAKSEAEAVTQAQVSLKMLGDQIWTSLIPVISAMTPVMSDIVQSVGEFIKTADLTSLGMKFKEIGVSISDFVKNLMSDEGRNKIVNDLQYYFRLIMIEVKKAINPFYNEEDAKKEKDALAQEKAAFDRVAAAKQVEMSASLSDKRLARKDTETAVAELKALQDKQNKDLAVAAAQNQTVGTVVGGAGGAAAGALTGAVVGSVIPVVGTAIGAAVGGVLGLLGGGAVGGAVSGLMPKRSTGSLGSTGKLFENFGSGTAVELHGTESVVTPQQMNEIISNASDGSAGVSSSLSSLIAINSELLHYMKQNVELSRRQVDATKSLNGNLFAV